MHNTCSAIILKKVAYGEADLIVTFFGRDEGRLSGIAKSARASQRRFGGALEVGSIVELRYVARRVSDLVRIEEAQIIRPTTGIMVSLNRLGAMSRALELALAFLPEKQAAPEKFDLLARYISHLADNDPLEASPIAFELKWLALVGYQPALEHCMTCQASLEDKDEWGFSLNHGGIFCRKCRPLNSKIVEMRTRTLKNLQDLAKGRMASLDRKEGSSVQLMLNSYVEHLLGRPLAGRAIAQQFL